MPLILVNILFYFRHAAGLLSDTTTNDKNLYLHNLNNHSVSSLLPPPPATTKNQHRNNTNNKTNNNSYNKDSNGGYFLSFKRRPNLVLVLTYTSIFMLGVALGFTPFIKVYIDTCQNDRRTVENLPAYFDNMTRIVDQLARQLNQSKSDEDILARYPQLANMYIKTAYGIGKNNISITCPIKINILFIEYSGTKADRRTIDEFNQYCEKNSPKGRSSLNCLVSLDLVYGIDILDKSAFTVIQYKCDA